MCAVYSLMYRMPAGRPPVVTFFPPFVLARRGATALVKDTLIRVFKRATDLTKEFSSSEVRAPREEYESAGSSEVNGERWRYGDDTRPSRGAPGLFRSHSRDIARPLIYPTKLASSLQIECGRYLFRAPNALPHSSRRRRIVRRIISTAGRRVRSVKRTVPVETIGSAEEDNNERLCNCRNESNRAREHNARSVLRRDEPIPPRYAHGPP